MHNNLKRTIMNEQSSAMSTADRLITIPRRLGASGIEVSPVGMGCMGLTHASGDPLPNAEAIRIVREAFEMGYTLFDTAEAYTGMRADGSTAYNEEVVGKALAPVRDKVTIVSKFGVGIDADRSLVLDSSPATIRASVEGSLRRLGTDYIDLYYQHRIDPHTAPEEVAEVMAELIAEGKIRSWGISEVTENYLRRAHAVCPVSAIENRYSMAARAHEALFRVCEELDVAFVAFSPMANGLLTGAYGANTTFEGSQDYRAGMPQYTEEGMARAAKLLEMLDELGKKHDATSAQISLAWVLAKRPYLIPIPGSRKTARLRENLAAAMVELSSQEMSALDAALDTMNLLVFGGHAAKN